MGMKVFSVPIGSANRVQSSSH